MYCCKLNLHFHFCSGCHLLAGYCFLNGQGRMVFHALLTWDRNTEELSKKGYKRMQLLNAAASWTVRER